MITKAMEEFQYREVKELGRKYFKQAQKAIEDNKEQWKQQFLRQMNEAFKNACIIQEKAYLEPAYCILHLKRTKIVNHQYCYYVTYYGEEWYEQEEQELGAVSFAFIYEYYEKCGRSWNLPAKTT